MSNKYLVWQTDFFIVEKPGNFHFFVIDDDSKNKAEKMINQTAYEILILIDGTKTFDDVVLILANKYNEDLDKVKMLVENFLNEINKSYGLHLSYLDEPNLKSVEIKKTNIYPTVASLELTNKCNMRCLHCYGNFGIENETQISLENAKKLFDDMYEVGIRSVESTGGECTVNSNFKEILSYALKVLPRVNILSNGINLSKEVLDIILDNKNKVFVQIDLHSLNDDYLYWFTGVKNSVEIIKNNIKFLAQNDVKLRVVTMTTNRNVDELLDIAGWLYENNVKWYAVSIVTKLGRAITSDTDIYLDKNGVQKFDEMLKAIKDNYPDLLVPGKTENDRKNCGCLTDHISIRPNGDIKICNMDSLTKNLIGNVFEESLKSIYDRNQKLLSDFGNLKPANSSDESCQDCEHKLFCSNCLLRTFVRGNELKNKCGYYKDKLSDAFKDKLHI